MQTETLWEITVSESVQGQDFESLQVCFFFFFGGQIWIYMQLWTYDVWWQYVV